MYVALKKINVGGTTLPPGSIVPDVDQWSETARRANIRQGFIKLVPDESLPLSAPHASAPVQAKVRETSSKKKRR